MRTPEERRELEENRRTTDRESAVAVMRIHLEELGRRERLNREEIVHHVNLLLSTLERVL